MQAHRLRWLRVIALSALLPGCWAGCGKAESGQNGGPCSSSSDCDGGYACMDGTCLAVCVRDDDCPSRAYVCGNGVCQAVPNAVCASDGECAPPGQCQTNVVCVAGRCVYGSKPSTDTCTDNNQCTNADHCDGAGGCLGTTVPCASRDGECVNNDSTYRTYTASCAPSTGNCSYAPTDTPCASCMTSCFGLLPNGGDCSGTGDAGCLSGHCDNNVCCASGSCCLAYTDCPASFSAPAVCADTSTATDCQGTRRNATCSNNQCGTLTVDDDSGCLNLVHQCPNNFAPVSCTAAATQGSPTCLTACSGTNDCLSGFVCSAPDCVCSGGGSESACGSADCCSDGADNDCDGLSDCEDGDCLGEVCRAATGICDLVEVCSSGQTSCPSDQKAATNAPCGTCSTCDGGGNCNQTPADDVACGTIDCDGLDSTCRDYVDLTTGRCASFGTCKAANDSGACTSFTNASTSTECRAADASGCDVADFCTVNGACASDAKAASGASCGACKTCDASGGCNQTPADDTVCGTIDCDTLDSTCRNYNDLTASRCEGFGDCKDANTTADCVSYSDATDGTNCGLCRSCTSGACTGTPADDANCGTVDCDGLDVACRNYDDLTAGRCEAFGDCKDANTADCTSFTNAGINSDCGACKTCDAAGGCTQTPADDADCGVIDCDVNDTACRDWTDITANRCEGFGDCKETADCTAYSDLSPSTSCGLCSTCNGAGLCNNTPLDDANCGTIDCDGLDVTCRNYNDLTTNRCLGFGTCKAANNAGSCTSYSNAGTGVLCRSADTSGCDVPDYCDGNGGCSTDGKASSGTSCGTCKTCNASGVCNQTPADDAGCGNIDCDALDYDCRDFNDLTSNRCEGFGDCKDANTTDCNSYSDQGTNVFCGWCSWCSGTGYCQSSCGQNEICCNQSSILCCFGTDCGTCML